MEKEKKYNFSAEILENTNTVGVFLVAFCFSAEWEAQQKINLGSTHGADELELYTFFPLTCLYLK